MSRDFEAAYSETGRPSIPPEALLKAMLLQALYSIPSERRLVDALNWNLLYRWFCDLNPDAEVWDATTFTRNRGRFERHGLVQKFFERVVAAALLKRYASNDHVTVDGTLIQSWASLKSFRPKEEKAPGPPDSEGGNPSVDFRGEKRSNDTHRSTTDSEARLSQRARKKVEQVFGWLKQPGGLRKVRHVGRWKIQKVAYLWAAAYNLLRMANLESRQAPARSKRQPGGRHKRPSRIFGTMMMSWQDHQNFKKQSSSAPC